MRNEQEWFQEWFDTPYYHLLYRHRDENEAQFFIRNLLEELKPSPRAHILDLACGRGRHALYINKLGHRVTGLDLSPQNIAHAKRARQRLPVDHREKLRFRTGDMRQDLGREEFDFVFNLFTSFGYFDQRQHNLEALRMIEGALVPGGQLILDFMNVNKVRLGLVKEEVRQAGGIEFHLERLMREGCVIKHISFEDQGREYHYEERVQLLAQEDFEDLLAEAGLQVLQLYGDFGLSPFDPRQSERLILRAVRPEE